MDSSSQTNINNNFLSGKKAHKKFSILPDSPTGNSNKNKISKNYFLLCSKHSLKKNNDQLLNEIKSNAQKMDEKLKMLFLKKIQISAAMPTASLSKLSISEE